MRYILLAAVLAVLTSQVRAPAAAAARRRAQPGSQCSRRRPPAPPAGHRRHRARRRLDSPPALLGVQSVEEDLPASEVVCQFSAATVWVCRQRARPTAAARLSLTRAAPLSLSIRWEAITATSTIASL